MVENASPAVVAAISALAGGLNHREILSFKEGSVSAVKVGERVSSAGDGHVNVIIQVDENDQEVR